MNRVVLGLGSNIGDSLNYLSSAESLINNEIGVIVQSSAVYESEPWGFEAKQNFLNKVIIIETGQNPHLLLKNLLEIELRLGRARTKIYSSRTIDIDILFFNDFMIKEENLKIPHPLIAERRFVLEPLNEIIPDYRHPDKKQSIKELLILCPDNSKLKIVNPVTNEL